MKRLFFCVFITVFVLSCALAAFGDTGAELIKTDHEFGVLLIV